MTEAALPGLRGRPGRSQRTQSATGSTSAASHRPAAPRRFPTRRSRRRHGLHGWDAGAAGGRPGRARYAGRMVSEAGTATHERSTLTPPQVRLLRHHAQDLAAGRRPERHDAEYGHEAEVLLHRCGLTVRSEGARAAPRARARHSRSNPNRPGTCAGAGVYILRLQMLPPPPPPPQTTVRQVRSSAGAPCCPPAGRRPAPTPAPAHLRPAPKRYPRSRSLARR